MSNQNERPRPPCPDNCNKTGYEYTDISLPIELLPYTTVGYIETSCIGEPDVRCETAPGSRTVRLIVSQRVKICIPLNIGVTAVPGCSYIECSSCGGPGGPRED